MRAMNAAPTPGARAQVAWSDGKVYPATICALAQNLVQVRWDAGGATAWVPLNAIVSVMPAAPVQPAQQPMQTAQQGGNPWGANAASQAAAVQPAQVPAQAQAQAQPTPSGWDPYAAYSKPSGTASARDVVPAAQQQPQQQQQPISTANAVRPAATQAPMGPPPRPMSSIEGLPRGLVYEPIAQGPGNGQVFFVFFGFLSTADIDVAMRMTDIEHIGDDVAALRAAGYRVVVDLHGDLYGLNAALTGSHQEAQGFATAGVFWGGHGNEDGSIHTFDGGHIDPEQIAPEVSARGTVKLFVMSACHAGSHSGRWQKAIGPRAQIIGWGAPITNERAIEFLTPDPNSSKGFDDLIERVLGARPVMGDAPLVEVRDLARQHEDRVALMNIPLDELVTRAHARLKCTMDKGKDGASYFTVRTPPSKSSPNVSRAQAVRVGPIGVGAAWINISSLVGPYSDALDLARAMRIVGDALHVRVTLAKMGAEGKEFVMVETLFRRRRLDVVTLANNIMTIGIYADRLEDMFFGSDVR